MSAPRPTLVIAADWSASSSVGPKSPAPDRCWIAWAASHHAPEPEYFRTRGACTGRVLELLSTHDGPAFVGFDFPIGYPPSEGGAAVLPTGRALVERIAAMVDDAPDATNNRFEVAAALNDEIRAITGAPSGPFWGRPTNTPIPGVPFTRPRSTGVRMFRAVEDHLKRSGSHPKSAWQLMGAGAAGGQALLGLPAIARILAAHPTRAALWPFERPQRHDAIVIGEIYPSLVDAAAIDHPIKDARQVVATRDALIARWDSGADPLDAPDAARREGWIAGVQSPESSESHTV